MPRPEQLPEWASDGDNILEPEAGKKAQGWLPNERPPAGFFNWLWNLTCAWVAHLDDVTLRAALVDQENTFTAGQTIDVLDAETAMLVSRKTAADHPANDTNLWKLELSFSLDGPRYMNVYSGPYDEVGSFAFTINAVWDVDTQLWQQDDTTRASSALIIGESDMRFSSVAPAGDGPTPPWSSWPQQGLGDFFLAGELRYFAAKFRETDLPLFDATLTGYAYVPGDNYLVAASAGNRAYFTVHVPSGAIIDAIQVIHSQSSTATDSLSLWHSTGAIFAEPPTAPGFEQIGSGVSAEATAGTRFTELTPLYEVNNEIEHYRFRVSAGAAGNTINGVRVKWRDFGPRNN